MFDVRSLVENEAALVFGREQECIVVLGNLILPRGVAPDLGQYRYETGRYGVVKFQWMEIHDKYSELQDCWSLGLITGNPLGLDEFLPEQRMLPSLQLKFAKDREG